MNRNKKVKDELTRKRKQLKQVHEILSPEDEGSLHIAELNYYLLKKFDFVLFSNDPRISDPNDKKRFNRVLNRYCNLNDIYDLSPNHLYQDLLNQYSHFDSPECYAVRISAGMHSQFF